jgi:hypothetical protein
MQAIEIAPALHRGLAAKLRGRGSKDGVRADMLTMIVRVD